MSVRAVFPAAILGVLSLSLGRAAQDDRLCADCHTTGEVAFEFPRGALDAEGRASYCSEVVGDERLNHGIPFLPCPKCRAPSLQKSAREKYDLEREAREEWLARQREIDAHLDDRKLVVMHCSTEHFDLTWTVPKVKVNRRTLDQHESMHLYADRLEQLYLDYLEQFGLSHHVEQNGVRPVIMCFEERKHSARAQPKYTGIGGGAGTSGSKLLGNKSVFVTYWDRSKNRDDREFHEYVMHNTVHLFLASSFNNRWIGREEGWLDEGFAHYWTERAFRSCRTHCYEEQDTLVGWVLDDWRPTVGRRVRADRVPPLAEVLGQPGTTLTADQHVFAWSWVQFLIDAHEPQQWVTLIREVKNRRPFHEALRMSYGYTTLGFLEKWKEYVLAEYPAR